MNHDSDQMTDPEVYDGRGRIVWEDESSQQAWLEFETGGQPHRIRRVRVGGIRFEAEDQFGPREDEPGRRSGSGSAQRRLPR